MATFSNASHHATWGAWVFFLGFIMNHRDDQAEILSSFHILTLLLRDPTASACLPTAWTSSRTSINTSSTDMPSCSLRGFVNPTAGDDLCLCARVCCAVIVHFSLASSDCIMSWNPLKSFEEMILLQMFLQGISFHDSFKERVQPDIPMWLELETVVNKIEEV